ncbi:MAG: hypothetical protein HYU78_09890 [Rhodocyclales bacterium]|nr:hypothetical protein [Rhodocyclales bacterium]
MPESVFERLGAAAAERKDRLFDYRAIGIALERLVSKELSAPLQVM